MSHGSGVGGVLLRTGWPPDELLPQEVIRSANSGTIADRMSAASRFSLVEMSMVAGTAEFYSSK
jgi:ApbE superfamily uncharacterized protein (UPF0280 family)